MTEIAVLTPDPSDPSYAGQWPGVLARLSEAMAASGLTATPTAWTDHIEDASGLMRYPLVLPVIAWGYHRDHGRWLQACATWAAAGVKMLNPPSVLAWNSDKSYLGRLAEQGVAIPPTLWTDHPTQADIDAAFDRFATDVVIVKPRVSGGAWKTLRLARGEALTDAPEGPAMIQPYLPTIETEGETSLLFFGGRLSHVVNKRPVPGEFRVQVQYGGGYVALPEPPAKALALAEKTLAAIGEDLLYARIDMAPDADGGWLLMEAELIEPDFYLASAPEGGKRFAEAVRARL
ncbi:MAG: transporter [Alphaproteobacteria bacterium]|nr:transporter [Alphaproteobacteria bacterium]MBU2041330.1 transporter [Alphaproteobacteria bacterium]MBU2125359.1 transporter [Alphaproteobacteria bacterium]MBU2209521.1 transporter [Alphaproteobacteria bacterium]MBU2289651.1 transporter [Alphaproteobacteria bacterium]